MTKNFDLFIENFLTELFPADIGDFGGATNTIKSGVPTGEPKGHFAPLQKLSDEDKDKVIEAILKDVFTERGNTYTSNVDDANQLHKAIQAAIKKVSGSTSLKASKEWASKFLADRFMTLLKGTVKYTTSGGEEIKKDVTQKEFKAALNKALKDTPETSVWKKSSDKEEEPKETQSEEETQQEEKDVEMVYTKSADLSSDDSDLQKAFNKLPEDKEMSWQEVVKLIGTSKALKLMDLGGLNEVAKEREVGEEEDVPDLEIDDEDDTNPSNFDRLINPYFDRSSNPYRGSSGDY